MGICFYLAVAVVMGRDVGGLAAKRGKNVLTVSPFLQCLFRCLCLSVLVSVCVGVSVSTVVLCARVCN